MKLRRLHGMRSPTLHGKSQSTRWPDRLQAQWRTGLRYLVLFSLPGFMQNHESSESFLFQYVKLLSQFSGPYANVPRELRMICWEIAKLTSELISFCQRMESADLTFNDIIMLLDHLKHHHICLSPKEKARLEGFSCPATECKVEITTDDQGPSKCNIIFRLTPAFYHTPYHGQLPFLNTPFSAILPPPIGIKGFPPICLAVYDSQVLFHNPSASPSSSCGLHCPGVLVQDLIHTLFSRVANFQSYELLITRSIVSPWEAWRFNDTK